MITNNVDSRLSPRTPMSYETHENGCRTPPASTSANGPFRIVLCFNRSRGLMPVGTALLWTSVAIQLWIASEGELRVHHRESGDPPSLVRRNTVCGQRRPVEPGGDCAGASAHLRRRRERTRRSLAPRRQRVQRCNCAQLIEAQRRVGRGRSTKFPSPTSERKFLCVRTKFSFLFSLASRCRLRRSCRQCCSLYLRRQPTRVQQFVGIPDPAIGPSLVTVVSSALVGRPSTAPWPASSWRSPS
jgi:hypothetical protein